MKNIFRKRTEDEKDQLKEEALKVLIEMVKIMAVNILATWMAVLIVTIIFGPKAMTPDGRTNVRESLNLNYILAYIFMLAMSAFCVIIRRSKFTYGDPVAEWNADKLGLYIKNLIAYAVINIPVVLYFIIADIAQVYASADTTSNQIGIAKLNTAESMWIANFFAPQATFYRLTRSIFLGVVINIAVYAGVMAIFYLVLKKKPPKNTNEFVAPVIDNSNEPNDDMNAVD